MNTKTKGMLIAGAAAALFLSGAVNARAEEKAGGDQVICSGINACKGRAAAPAPATRAPVRTRCKGQGNIKATRGRLQGEGRQGRRGRVQVRRSSMAGPGSPGPLISMTMTLRPHTSVTASGSGRQHYPAILDDGLRADWFEAISENYMLRGGRPLHVLERVRAERPIVLHGVSLSLGATDPLNARVPRRAARARRRASSRRGCRTTSAGAATASTTRTTCCRCRTPRRRSTTSSRASARAGRARAPASLVENVSSYVDVRALDDDRVGVPRRASPSAPTAASCST